MYEKTLECPECGERIADTAKKCNCGWHKGNNVSPHDGRCIFVLNGNRCRLVGSNSPRTFKNNDWYCAYHYEHLGNFSESGRWTNFIEKNLHEIIHYRQHCQTNFKNCERCEKLCIAEKEFRENQKMNVFENDYEF